MYENFENSLRDSNLSESDFDQRNGNCDIESILTNEKYESDTDSPQSKVPEDDFTGVFTIRIPTHRLLEEEDPPCIVIETNSHSEA